MGLIFIFKDNIRILITILKNDINKTRLCKPIKTKDFVFLHDNIKLSVNNKKI